METTIRREEEERKESDMAQQNRNDNTDSQARSIPVRKDDEVLIVRGKYKGREGKVTQVSMGAACSPALKDVD
jgi:ribosomal protein uL24